MFIDSNNAKSVEENNNNVDHHDDEIEEEEDPKEKVLKDTNLMCHTFSFLVPRDLECTTSTTNTSSNPTTDHHHHHHHHHHGGGYSFFERSNQDLTSIEAIARLSAKLSLVCRAWKLICDHDIATIAGPYLAIHSKQLLVVSKTTRSTRSGASSSSSSSHTTNNNSSGGIVDKNIPNSNNNNYESSSVVESGYPGIDWICKFDNNNNNNSKKSALQLAWIGPFDISNILELYPLLRLLEHCNLSYLKTFQVTFYWSEICSSNLIEKDKMRVVTKQLQQRLHEELSTSSSSTSSSSHNSSNLKQAEIGLILSAANCIQSRQEQYVNIIRRTPSPFRLPTIRRLHLSVEDTEAQSLYLRSKKDGVHHDVNPNINNLLISNLPKLTHLKLSGAFHFLQDAPTIRISSPILQHLDVVGLRRVTVQLCAGAGCPQLKHYRCDTLNYSGSLPLVQTEQQLKQLMKDHVNPPGQFGDLIVTAGMVDFPGLTPTTATTGGGGGNNGGGMTMVPDNCVVTVLNFGYWQRFRFESYQIRLQEIQDSLLSASAAGDRAG